jgi:rhamnosyltransferase
MQSLAVDVLVIDSGSIDGTVAASRDFGFTVEPIQKSDFNHGGTRQYAVGLCPAAEIIVFMTQDAIPTGNDALVRLIAAFDDPAVGAAYGRQLPRPHSGLIEAHARLFNYPDQSYVATLSDRGRLGIKAAFLSNSFAAYRRVALEAVGGFPAHVILGEDTYVAGKMLLAGWKIAYRADAQVFHSHGYSYLEEFRRYFDIGVFHHRAAWMLTEFGKPEGEGGRFVRSEVRYLWGRAPWLIPSALLRTILKYAGYRLGRMESGLPLRIKIACSMHKGFWVSDRRG